MRWFLGVAIVIVTALVVAHRRNETVRHRARDAARVSETSSTTAAHVASGQASARVPGGTTTLRVNLVGDPEHTSMVMLVPAKGGDRLLPASTTAAISSPASGQQSSSHSATLSRNTL